MTITLTDPLFSTDDFAENATVYETSGSGTGSVIPVIFDDGYQEGIVGGMAYQNADPRVTVRTSDVSSLVVDSLVVLRSINYRVRTIDDDGTGVSVLHLSREAIVQ
jgi:hypothetical protein